MPKYQQNKNSAWYDDPPKNWCAQGVGFEFKTTVLDSNTFFWSNAKGTPGLFWRSDERGKRIVEKGGNEQ
jgi:hypothetical protein